MLQIKTVNPLSNGATALIDALDELQSSLYPPQSNHLDSAADLKQPNVHFLGVFEGHMLLGCGAVKLLDDTQDSLRYGEIKRMFVTPAERGKGIAKRLMVALEARAKEGGATLLRLETGIYQPAAIALYSGLGFVQRGPFGAYAPDDLSVFMEKRL